MLRPWLTLTLSLAACPVAALDLPAAAVESATRDLGYAAQSLPSGRFDGADTPMVETEGTIRHTAYRLAGSSLTTAQILSPLRAQLEAEGFTTRFTCDDRICGGFDFRYLLDLIPEPALHIDLGNFKYLLATHTDGRAMVLITSRAAQSGYLQITSVTPTHAPVVALAQSQTAASATGTYTATMEAQGHVALDDLSFESGSTTLGAGSFASLSEIASYLKARPNARVVLVGHSDTTGGLAGNTALSRKRADAVRYRLMSDHGVNAAQIGAEGIGYLAPRSSNATKDGRAANRRVEAILVPTP